MKVDNSFVVEVRRAADGAPLPEIKAGADTHIIAKPGVAFTVSVKRLEGDSFTECVKVRSATRPPQRPGLIGWLAPGVHRLHDVLGAIEQAARAGGRACCYGVGREGLCMQGLAMRLCSP
jgi:hypothetical protein